MIFNLKKRLKFLSLLFAVPMFFVSKCECVPPSDNLRSIHVLESWCDPHEYSIQIYDELSNVVKSVKISVLGKSDERCYIPPIYKDDANFEEVKNAIYEMSDMDELEYSVYEGDDEQEMYFYRKRNKVLRVIFDNFNI